MKVKLLVPRSGADGSFIKGDEIEVSAHEAKRMFEADPPQAIPVKADVGAAFAIKIHTTSMEVRRLTEIAAGKKSAIAAKDKEVKTARAALKKLEIAAEDHKAAAKKAAQAVKSAKKVAGDAVDEAKAEADAKANAEADAKANGSA